MLARSRIFYQTCPEWQHERIKQTRHGGEIVFELLGVAIFNLLHEGFALEEVALEVGGELAGDDEELVVGNFGERDGAAGGNEMRTLLEDEACVPRNHKKSERSRGRESEGLLTSMGTNAECVVPYFMTIAVAVWVWWIISENKYPSKTTHLLG